MNPLERVVVIGTSCSGKTTFALQLAGRLGVPHIELDHLHWLPDWEARSDDEFRRLVQQATSADRWLVDGNYSKVRDITWSRATAIVWLDYSVPVVFGRALRRSVKRIVTREELFAGNRESFHKTFLSRDSILLWVVTTFKRRRREYPELFAEPEYQHLFIYRLPSPAAESRFLATISNRPSNLRSGA
jgi:adenylate kinase family enzyme